ncbi:hypothetical protein N0V85_009916, partial [Neurospora sp. IMI 360204]
KKEAEEFKSRVAALESLKAQMATQVNHQQQKYNDVVRENVTLQRNVSSLQSDNDSLHAVATQKERDVASAEQQYTDMLAASKAQNDTFAEVNASLKEALAKASQAKILREELDYTKQKLKEAQINAQWNAEFNKPAEATNNKFPKGTNPFVGTDEDVWSDIYSAGDDKPDGAGGANGRGYGGGFSVGRFGADGTGRADGG